jgi:hypothetical protein
VPIHLRYSLFRDLRSMCICAYGIEHEKSPAKLLEESGVGRIMESEDEDEDETWAAHMDG